MADVSHREVERYRVTFMAHSEERQLSLRKARGLLARGLSIALFVDGWTEPWPCRLSNTGDVLARCPGSKIESIVGIAP